MKALIWIVVILVVIALGFIIFSGKDSNGTTTLPGTQQPIVQQIEEVEITATDFEFSVDEIRVKQGDLVRINLKNDKGTHDWKIDQFNISTNVLNAGEEETVEFVANTTGTFEYYCSVGNHRQLGMKGNLIIE